jgi:Gpi18-like mannosyltransferase
MFKKLKGLALIALISLIPTFLIWLPFFLKVSSFWNIPLPQDGMATIVANYDGPLYIVVAKSLYAADVIKKMVPFSLPVEYYAAHFPLFPLLIKPLAAVLGFPYSMLAVTIIGSILATYFFYKFACLYFSSKDALWLTCVFSILPARWLVVRSVGSPEPLFIAAIIASLFYFKKERYWLAGIWGAVAQLTKSPGILLFAAYFLTLTIPNIKRVALEGFSKVFSVNKILKFLPIFLIPVSLLGVFVLYKIRLNDFFAYFHSGDNIHLFFPPFQIFNYSASWVGTFWLEEIIFVYLLGVIGFQKLIQQKKHILAWFVGVFFTTTLFVSHRDLIRYSLPIVPFLIIAYGDTIVKKEFKFAMLLLVIPIYLFSLAYISQNTMPISDWAPLL